jgi:two-component system, OmpR family, sensor kinase
VRRALGSLRWRLTLTYVALLAALLAALGAVQYVAVQRSLMSTRVSTLRGDLQEAVADVLNPLRRPPPVPRRTTRTATQTAATPRRAARLDTPRPGGRAIPARPARARPTPAPTSRPAAATTPAPAARVLRGQACSALTAAALGGLARELADRTALISGRSVSVVVYDRDLVPIGSSPGGASDVPGVSPAELDRAFSGAQSGSRVVEGPRGRVLAVTFPVRPAAARSGPACLAAELATPMAPIDAVLGADRAVVVGGGAAVVVLALVAGLWLTDRALRPLHRVTDTAGRLAAGDLRARSRLPERADEVGTLARAFDDMADRIEVAFAAQAESEARTRRFIADASHELRTPVTALKGYVDVLRRGVSRDPEALEAALAGMARETERMRVLVLDLLTLARIDAAPPAGREPLDLNEVVASVLDEGVPGMPEALERRFASGPVTVVADRSSVVTVARNLLVNACAYASGSRQLWATEVAGGHAVLTVADEGPGIPATDLPHVFERFYRGEKTRARQEGGSGLGLSIVQGLVRAQGGEVAIASQEGRGTRVRVRLPLAAEAPPASLGSASD